MSWNSLFRISAAFVIAYLPASGSLAADPALRDDALALFEPIPESPEPAPDPAAVVDLFRN